MMLSKNANVDGHARELQKGEVAQYDPSWSSSVVPLPQMWRCASHGSNRVLKEKKKIRILYRKARVKSTKHRENRNQTSPADIQNSLLSIFFSFRLLAATSSSLLKNFLVNSSLLLCQESWGLKNKLQVRLGCPGSVKWVTYRVEKIVLNGGRLTKNFFVLEVFRVSRKVRMERRISRLCILSIDDSNQMRCFVWGGGFCAKQSKWWSKDDIVLVAPCTIGPWGRKWWETGAADSLRPNACFRKLFQLDVSLQDGCTCKTHLHCKDGCSTHTYTQVHIQKLLNADCAHEHFASEFTDR